jgi:hypothetical protein
MFLQSLMGAVNVEDQVQCKTAVRCKNTGICIRKLAVEKAKQISSLKREAYICGHRRSPSIFSESLKQDSIALDLSHVEIA